MAMIRLARAHQLPRSRARAMLLAVAEELAREHGCRTHWDGAELGFRRTGLHGRVDVSDSQVAVEIDLAPMLRPWRRLIEQRLRYRLEALLAAAGLADRRPAR